MIAGRGEDDAVRLAQRRQKNLCRLGERSGFGIIERQQQVTSAEEPRLGAGELREVERLGERLFGG